MSPHVESLIELGGSAVRLSLCLGGDFGTGQFLPDPRELEADAVDLVRLDRVRALRLEQGADERVDGVIGRVGVGRGEERVDVR